MRLVKPVLAMAVVAAVLQSCGGNNQPADPKDPVEPEAVEPTCEYTINTDSLKVYWTSYKHTAKAEVGGWFDSVAVEGVQPFETAAGAISMAKFTIWTQTSSSGDDGRDKKVREIFFGGMANPETITGSVNEVSGDNNEGEGKFNVNMNGVEVQVPFTYEVSDGMEVTIRAEFDFVDWGTQEAIDALQAACEEKHTGADGVTKFWTEGKVVIKTMLGESCE